jgi:hypothetical protein
MSDLSPISDALLSWWLAQRVPAAQRSLDDLVDLYAAAALTARADRDDADDADDDWMWRCDAPQVQEKGRVAARRARKLAYQRRGFEELVTNRRSSVLNKMLNRRCGEPWEALRVECQQRFTGRRFGILHLQGPRPLNVEDVVTLYDEHPHAVRGVLRGGHYVCPLSGRLKRVQRTHHDNDRRRARHRHAKPVNLPNAGGQIHWLANGARGPGWYLLTLAPIPPRAQWAETFDLVLNRTLAALDQANCVPALLQSVLFVEGMYAASARWMTPRELLKHGRRDRRQRRMTRDDATFRRARPGQTRPR